MTEEQLIDSIFTKEGDVYADQTTTPPVDQPTARGGITLQTLQSYVDATSPGRTATVQDLKTLTHAQAREVVRWKLRRLADQMKFAQIDYEPLRIQMVDFAYNSGEALAIRWLQRVLRLPRTSRMDPPTITRVNEMDPFLVNQSIIAARLQMIEMASAPGGKIDAKYEHGLEARALTFSLLEIP